MAERRAGKRGLALRSGVWMKMDFWALRIRERKASFWGTKRESLVMLA